MPSRIVRNKSNESKKTEKKEWRKKRRKQRNMGILQAGEQRKRQESQRVSANGENE